MSTTNSATTISLNKKRSLDQIGSDDEEIDNEPAKKRRKLAHSNNANNKQQQNQLANQQNANQTNNESANNNQTTLIEEMTGIIDNSQLFPKYISRLIAEFSIVHVRNCTKCQKQFDILSSQKDAIFA
eukprot:98853_1